jgi:hypothetical protein
MTRTCTLVEQSLSDQVFLSVPIVATICHLIVCTLTFMNVYVCSIYMQVCYTCLLVLEIATKAMSSASASKDKQAEQLDDVLERHGIPVQVPCAVLQR